MRQTSFELGTWIEVKDGNDTARDIFKDHYSRRRYADGRKPLLFVGPGEKMVLVTPGADALFVWRKFISLDDQTGINCAVFRNESDQLSSELILEAEKLAWQRWPNQRMYTYVNPRKVKSRNPGFCFLKAGWRKCGFTKSKLIILEKFPPSGVAETVKAGQAEETRQALARLHSARSLYRSQGFTAGCRGSSAAPTGHASFLER